MALKYELVVPCYPKIGDGDCGSLWTFSKEADLYSSILTAPVKSKHNVLVMLGNSYFGLPEKVRSYAERINVVVIDQRSQRSLFPPSMTVLESLESLEVYLANTINRVFIICDSSSYKLVLASPHLYRIYLTKCFGDGRALSEFDLPDFKRVFSEDVPACKQSENGVDFEFQVYQKKENVHFDMSMMVAASENLGIALNQRLPWPHLKSDVEMYLRVTQTVKKAGGKVVNIRGRFTYLCASQEEMARENVITIVLTSNRSSLDGPDDLIVVPSLPDALNICKSMPEVEHVWVMGGSSVYKECLKHPECDKIYITEIERPFEADTFFPEEYKDIFYRTSCGEKIVENDVPYRMNVYTRKSLSDGFSG